MENVLSFENNTIYRLDYYLYSVVHETYKNHYNYEKIKEFVRYDKLTNGASDFVKMIKQIHNFSDEEMYFRTGFNFDQEKDTKIINMYSKYDAIVNRDISMKYTEANKKEFDITHDTIAAIGHCSDLWSPNIRILKYLLY
jgi:formyltetrahydrofolate synthetase